MRRIIGLALFFASLGYAQSVTRTVHLVNTKTPQGLQIALTVLRTVCDINDMTLDSAASTVTITDTPAAVALAEWTLAAIDTTTPMATQQYTIPYSRINIVKVMYLEHTDSDQAIQELITQLRTVVDLAKVFVASGPRAVVFRGDALTIAAASWLITQLDKPFTPGAAPVSYPFGSEQVRVYYLHNIATPKPTQELLTAIRMQTKVQHVFNSSGPRAIAVRGSSDQLVAADALVAKLDIP